MSPYRHWLGLDNKKTIGKDMERGTSPDAPGDIVLGKEEAVTGTTAADDVKQPRDVMTWADVGEVIDRVMFIAFTTVIILAVCSLFPFIAYKGSQQPDYPGGIDNRTSCTRVSYYDFS